MKNFKNLVQYSLGDFIHQSPLDFFVRPLHGESLRSDFPVDVKESDGAYIVHANLPGIKKEDISISIENDQFTISATVDQFDQKKENEKIIQSERYHGYVSRTIRLPQTIDKSTSTAVYENGVLEIELVKERKKGARNLEIK